MTHLTKRSDLRFFTPVVTDAHLRRPDAGSLSVVES
jgi:hypothetical protein